MSRELGELERRVANMIRIGSVDSVSGDRCRVTVAGILSPPMKWIAGGAGEDRRWWPPSSGEQVLVLAPGGDLAQAVAVCGIFGGAYPAPDDRLHVRKVTFADGTVVEYDREESTLLVDAVGDVTVKSAGAVVFDTSTVKLGGPGASDALVRKSDLDAAMATVEAWVNGHTHPYVDSPVGAAVTSTPTPPGLSVTTTASGVAASE